MISIVSGAVVVGAGVVGLWYLMPHHGRPHWHTEVPILDSVIPFTIVAALGAGIALIISGVAGTLI